MALEIGRGAVVAGRVFGVERKVSKSGKKFQVGSIGISKKNEDGTYENGFLRFTLFGETPIESKQDYTLSGQLQPLKYTTKDGKAIDTFELVAYEVGKMKEFASKDAKPEPKKQTAWDDVSDEEEVPF